MGECSLDTDIPQPHWDQEHSVSVKGKHAFNHVLNKLNAGASSESWILHDMLIDPVDLDTGLILGD